MAINTERLSLEIKNKSSSWSNFHFPFQSLTIRITFDFLPKIAQTSNTFSNPLMAVDTTRLVLQVTLKDIRSSDLWILPLLLRCRWSIGGRVGTACCIRTYLLFPTFVGRARFSESSLFTWPTNKLRSRECWSIVVALVYHPHRCMTITIINDAPRSKIRLQTGSIFYLGFVILAYHFIGPWRPQRCNLWDWCYLMLVKTHGGGIRERKLIFCVSRETQDMFPSNRIRWIFYTRNFQAITYNLHLFIYHEHRDCEAIFNYLLSLLSLQILRVDVHRQCTG